MVSVVIPSYNRSSELPRALESVINQSFKNWEIIIVDDGSTDNTTDVVKTFQKKHKNIHYYYFNNMGASVARNIGVGLSKGELVAFLDSDDVWTAGRLQAVYEKYSANPDAPKLYLTDFRSHISSKTFFDHELVKSEIFRQSLYAINHLGGTINMVIPRKELIKIGGFDSGLASVEDHDLYIRMIQNLEIEYVPGEYAIYYLDSPNRISGKNSRRLLGQIQFYKKHKNKMSILSRLLVMKKNSLIGYYNHSLVAFKYFPAWLIIWTLKKIFSIKNDLDLYKKTNRFLDYLKL